VLAVCAAGVLALVVGLWGIWLWNVYRQHLGVFDFSQYYAAARALRLDPHADIYSPDVLNASAAAGQVAQQPPAAYLYTVLPAFLLIPLTLLPFAVAAQIWLTFNALIWIGATLLLANELRHLLHDLLRDQAPVDEASTSRVHWTIGWERLVADPSWLVALAASAALCFLARPTTATLALGQINLLALFPLAVTPSLLRHRREAWVGVAIALATMVRLTPVLLLGYLALTRQWRALAWSIGALAALSLACIIIVGPQTFFALFPAVVQTAGAHAAAGTNNVSLFGPVGNALTNAAPALGGIIRGVTYALLALLAGVAGWILLRSRGGQTGDPGEGQMRVEHIQLVQYALAICALLLLPPYVEPHHYAMLLPAEALLLGLLVQHWRKASDPRQARVALLALGLGVLACVLVALPLPNGWDWDWEPYARASLLFGLPLRPWLQELRPLGALLLFLLGAQYALRGPDARVQVAHAAKRMGDQP
jgi:hypothetical protein